MSHNDNIKDQGIDATNQDFQRYEQVNKKQSYHLSEHLENEEFDEDFEIKTIDFSLFSEGSLDGKMQFASELGDALKEIGFAVLTNHGVDIACYDKAGEKIRELFESTTFEERIKYKAQRYGSVNQGYFPIKETTIIHPDLVEGWVFCRRAFKLNENSDYTESNYWPRPGFEPVFRQVVLAHEQLIKPIMQSILSYLEIDPHFYDKKLDRTNFGLRLNYYPPMADQKRGKGGGRMLGHEDIDLFTILPACNTEGLQVLNRSNMKWIRLDPRPGDIILNTGDYMQRISNDILPSTTHRVSWPENYDQLLTPRLSFPMAVYVWENELLEVLPNLGIPKYKPIRAEKFHTSITSKYYGDEYAIDVSD